MKNGQALVEIIIAVAVAVIALLSISQITSRSIFNTGSATRQNTAKNYAQDAVDRIRKIKNDLGLSWSTSSLLADGTWCFNGSTFVGPPPQTYCDIAGTEFQGRITISKAQIPPLTGKWEMTVVAEVQWVEANLTRSVKNEAKMVFDQ